MAGNPSRNSTWGYPLRVKPRLQHLIAGLIASAASYTLLFSLDFTNLLADALVEVMSLGQISVMKLSSNSPSLVVRLLDGSSFSFVVTWQRSGLIPIAIFGLLIVFLLFPLDGSIWRKMAWLEIGFVVGLTWSFVRLAITIVAAYHFGADFSVLVEFFTSPFLDFLWVVSVWALALSTLKSVKKRRVEKKWC